MPGRQGYTVFFVIGMLCALLGLSFPQSAKGQVERIAAVVNSDVITLSELENRLALTILSSGLDSATEVRERLRPQVLQDTIDDLLRLQEAANHQIRVSEDDISAAFARMAQNNGMEAAEFEQILTENNVPPTTIKEQIRASIAWSILAQLRFAEQIRISDREVDDVIHRARQAYGKPEYHVYEILLTVGDRAQENQVRQLAERLIEELKRGAPFAAVARQFSQSAGAARGGEVGWVNEGQLALEIDEALSGMVPGQIAGPIRTLSGYHIIYLDDRRIAGGEAALKQGKQYMISRLVLPLQTNAPEPVVTARRAAAEKIRDEIKGCDALDAAAPEQRLAASGRLGPVPEQNFPAPLRQLLEGLEIGEPSPLIRSDEGIVIIMVCERIEPETTAFPEAGSEERELIRQNLLQDQINLRQRRYMRDLRNNAFIDIRM